MIRYRYALPVAENRAWKSSSTWVSRLAAIDTVLTTIEPGGPETIDEDQTLAFMQAINAVRLVLGSMLQIDDDDDDDDDDTPEHHLYTFLSWVLEWTVRALSPSGR